MKLNPDELVVSSFETADAASPILPVTDDPTPATRCFWCPGAPTIDPGTVVVTE
jgi:hypothetical protein